MARPGRRFTWLGILAAAAVGAALLAGCASPAAAPADSALADEVTSLKQQAATQAQRIDSLETQAAAGSQAGRITDLETKVAQGLTAAAPTATEIPLPTATIVPPVAGLTTEGSTKGAASAKVTIIEYVDYF